MNSESKDERDTRIKKEQDAFNKKVKKEEYDMKLMEDEIIRQSIAFDIYNDRYIIIYKWDKDMSHLNIIQTPLILIDLCHAANDIVLVEQLYPSEIPVSIKKEQLYAHGNDNKYLNSYDSFLLPSKKRLNKYNNLVSRSIRVDICGEISKDRRYILYLGDQFISRYRFMNWDQYFKMQLTESLIKRMDMLEDKLTILVDRLDNYK